MLLHQNGDPRQTPTSQPDVYLPRNSTMRHVNIECNSCDCRNTNSRRDWAKKSANSQHYKDCQFHGKTFPQISAIVKCTKTSKTSLICGSNTSISISDFQQLLLLTPAGQAVLLSPLFTGIDKKQIVNKIFIYSLWYEQQPGEEGGRSPQWDIHHTAN